MVHSKIIEIYMSKFRKLGKISEWFANGHNSVRVRYKNGTEYIFTLREDLTGPENNIWKLESTMSFIARINK